MSTPGPVMEILGRLAYNFAKAQPFLPTYFHLLASALFPIYTGAHASLSPPSSAAKPSKRKTKTDDDDEDPSEVRYQKMEGLSPEDALMIPVLAGCTLAILYFIINWLQDPALLNLILNWYLSCFGVLSVARWSTDVMGIISSYAFPAVYRDSGQVWKVRRDRRIFETMQAEDDASVNPSTRPSPLPGILSRLPLSQRLLSLLWTLRELPAQKLLIRVHFYQSPALQFLIGPQGFSGIVFAVAALLYFNLVDKPWWLTNVLGFSVSYSVLQLLSPTTFWTGTMILSSLFVYDIYFVFFTPLMMAVATNLDIPAKLLFPRPRGPNDDPNEEALSMLGLGDVVLPGIMIGLALRFDLYLFYLRKQTRRNKLSENDGGTVAESVGATTVEVIRDDKEDATFKNTGAKVERKTEQPIDVTSEIVKSPWRSATGRWGERFWLGWFSASGDSQEGGTFPKFYFHAALLGYIFGMICTLGIMQIYNHAQPALLYLVPCVLGSLWLTALVKGDLKTMWEYTEANKEDTSETDKDGKLEKRSMRSIFSFARHEERAATMSNKAQLRAMIDEAVTDIEKKPKVKCDDAKVASLRSRQSRELFCLSVSLPPRAVSRPEETFMSLESFPKPDGDLVKASEDPLGSENSSGGSSPRRKSFGGEDDGADELARKRQRLV